MTVGDEGGARGEDPRCNAVRQRRQVGVDDRVLNGVQRQTWLAGGPWLGARQHQAVSRLTGADGALRREGGDPDTLRQLRCGRIETVARVAQRVAAPGAMDQVQMVGKHRPALLAGQAEGQK